MQPQIPSTQRKVLISIPAKNEAKTIAGVIQKSKSEVEKLNVGNVVILVINDGSTDTTAFVAEEAGAVVFSHLTSVGLGTVFQEAVTYATENDFDYMITIDGDGQFSETDVPSLLTPLIKGQADFVTGSRFMAGSKTHDMPALKRWGNYVVARFVSSVLKTVIKDVSCGFRAYNKKALYHLNLFGGFTYTQEVLLNLGYKNVRIVEVPITTTYFKERKSRIAHNLFSYGWRVLKIMLTSVIFYRPMKFFGFLSIAHILLGILCAYLPISNYLARGSITPYKALGIIALVAVILSVMFLIVGIFMQSISRLQISIDRLLYYQKRQQH